MTKQLKHLREFPRRKNGIKKRGKYTAGTRKSNVKILYHGTDYATKILNNGFKCSNVSLYGKGIYFFENKSFAKLYGKQIIKSKVNVGKVFNFSTDSQKRLYSKLYNKYDKRGSSFPQKDTVEELNKKYGYDSFVFTDFSRSRTGGIAWLIFDKNRVKSIKF